MDELLTERKSTHGHFPDLAVLSQELKRVVRRNDNRLELIHQEALDMILHKVARILAGDPNFADHWQDIAGYAIRVSEFIEETNSLEPQNFTQYRE